MEIDGNIDLPGGKRGAFDYFIRDYQQNVRMILTEETHYGINRATMEDNRSGSEEPVFGQEGIDNQVAATRASTPAGWTSNTTAKVSKLSKAGGHSIGPNVLLKVMAGDTLNAMTDYYYYDAPVTNNSNPLLGDVVSGLLQAITGSIAVDPLIHGNLSAIGGDLGSSVPLGSIADPDKGTVDNIPRAYLSVIFFNERFEFIEESSTALRVSQSGDNAAPLVLSSIKASKNGYAYIYLSNENNQPVYFDNFAVSDARGRIIEENHYYAFGLRIAGISSKKYDGGLEGSLKNDYLYNDKELWDDGDLNWYDYGFRNYDAQIARFTQLDPLTWDYPELTNYQYASNEPVANVDLDGLEAYKVLEEIVVNGPIKPARTVANLTGKSISSGISHTFQTTLTSFAGATSAFVDNLIGSNITERISNSGAIPSPQYDTWNNAVETTNKLSLVFGMGEMFLGGKMMEGGGGALLLLGGISAEVSVPAILVGGAMSLHGGLVVNNAYRNLAAGKGKIKSGGGNYNPTSQPKYKRPKSGISGKEGAKDIPDWARGERPFTNEDGKSFARRLLDRKYGRNNYGTGPGSEFSKIKKWVDRSFD